MKMLYSTTIPDLTFEVYGHDIKDLRLGSEIATKNRLFVRDWDLSKHYRKVMKLADSISESIGDCFCHEEFSCRVESVIILASIGGKYIASSTAQKTSMYRDIMIYVKKKFRRRGIGRSLYNLSMQELGRTRPFCMASGVPGSGGFDRKMTEEVMAKTNKVSVTS
jgi:GNAT superfamily N-acetyltransferase